MTKIFRDDDFDDDRDQPGKLFGDPDQLMGRMVQPNHLPHRGGLLARIFGSVNDARDEQERGRTRSSIEKSTGEVQRQANQDFNRGALAVFGERLAEWVGSIATACRLSREKNKVEGIESCYTTKADSDERVTKDTRYSPETQAEIKAMTKAICDETAKAIATDETLRRAGLDPSGE